MRLRKIWDSYWGRIAWGSAGLFVALPLVVCAFGGEYTLGVYIGTGIAVLWYTVETYYLRRETARQNEITVCPLVMGSMEYSEGYELVARNVGNGVAIFIHIHDMVLVDPAGDRVRFTAKFAGLSHLEKGQERPIIVLERVPIDAGVDPQHLSVRACLNPDFAVETYTMRIEYQDIRGGVHWSETQMGRGGISLLGYS